MKYVKTLDSFKPEDIVLLIYDDYNEDFEELGLDFYEIGNKADKLSNKSEVNILRDKELHAVLINKQNGDLIGASWINQDNPFSFDIIIDKIYQRKGLSKLLIDDALNEYEFRKSMYEEQGDKLKIELDVVNINMKKILINYGFKVKEQIAQNRFIMYK